MSLKEVDFRNGIKNELYIEDGKRVIKRTQDISHDIEYATQLRNADEYTKNGIKAGFWHVAHIPDIVVDDLRLKGINIYTDSGPDIIAALKKYGYDYLLTTTKRIA